MPKTTNKTTWLKLFLSSFRPNPRFLIMMLLDFIFLVLLFNASYFLSYKINQAAAIVGKNKIDDLATTSLTQLEATTNAMQSFFRDLYLYAFLFVLFVFLIIVIFQSLNYTILLGKRPDLRYFGNFFLANLIWIPAVSILFFAIFKLFKENAMIIVFLIAFLLSIHFANILYILLAKRGKVFKSMKTALSLGAGKIYIFIVPLIIGAAAFYASNFTALIGMPGLIITAILLLYVMAWFRNYTSIMLEKEG